MSFESLLGQAVTVLRRAYTSRDVDSGVPVPGAETAVETRGRLERTDPLDITRDWDTITTDYRLFLPADVTLRILDRVTVDGATYEVATDPSLEVTPRGAHHQVVRLTRVRAVRDLPSTPPVIQ